MPSKVPILSVTGADEVAAYLESAPRVLVAEGWLKALVAAAEPLAVELAVNTPNGKDFAVVRDKLNESQVREIEIDSQLRGGTLTFGFGKNGYIAYFLEYGHRMVGHKPELKQLFSKANPGQTHVLPDPFMARAANAAFDAVISAFAASLTQSVKQFNARFK